MMIYNYTRFQIMIKFQNKNSVMLRTLFTTLREFPKLFQKQIVKNYRKYKNISFRNSHEKYFEDCKSKHLDLWLIKMNF